MIEGGAIQGTGVPEAIERLRAALRDGKGWPTAFVETMALWTQPQEEFDGQRYDYFIGGEAFDWLALASRLSCEVEDLIPREDIEEMLFTGRFPAPFGDEEFEELLGGDKHRGHLNYFYGVEVETALQQTVESEIEKRHYANGRRYGIDHAEEAYFRIYRSTESQLLAEYQVANGIGEDDPMTLTGLKEFTYWLFKRRLRVSDKAKIASDTLKGLQLLNKASMVPFDLSALAY
jgi:hypothetical protein